MIQSPDIEWLQRKWELPDGAIKAVRNLMLEEARGSTACLITDGVPDWGMAAGGHEAVAPLVVTEQEGKCHIQSRRLFLAERGIARRILEMAEQEPVIPVTAAKLSTLFPEAAQNDLQSRAASMAMSRQLAMITGGPGTGKTHTLARILALLVDSGISPDLIHLAAPTGKASDRMKKAVSDSLSGLPGEFQRHQQALALIADSSSTLHKLLGYNPRSGGLRFDEKHPLPCRVLIVDECSMVDVLLWQAVLQALPPDSRLVLLGDPNQLESVGQGHVFAELTRAAAITGSKLSRSHVHLTEARRFKERPDILAFARALEQSDADSAVKLLEEAPANAPSRGLGWLKMAGATLPCEDFPQPVLDALKKVAMAGHPQDALDALGRVCILTPHREFFVGSKAVSAAIERYFFHQNGTRNQPVIINHNDSETGLRNGTIGVIHTSSDGKRKAWFQSGSGKLKDIAVAKLPDFSPAWAITIHRSQGSEYDDVLVMLPREESPMACRELLYTAITRAKHNVYVAGEIGSVRKAATTSSERCTMLASFLQD